VRFVSVFECCMCIVEERKRRRESGEGWVKERQASYTWCAAVAKSTVNHGGVSKRELGQSPPGPAWA